MSEADAFRKLFGEFTLNYDQHIHKTVANIRDLHIETVLRECEKFLAILHDYKGACHHAHEFAKTPQSSEYQHAARSVHVLGNEAVKAFPSFQKSYKRVSSRLAKAFKEVEKVKDKITENRRAAVEFIKLLKKIDEGYRFLRSTAESPIDKTLDNIYQSASDGQPRRRKPL